MQYDIHPGPLTLGRLFDHQEPRAVARHIVPPGALPVEHLVELPPEGRNGRLRERRGYSPHQSAG